MARTAITTAAIKDLTTRYPVLPLVATSQDITFDAGDASSGHKFPLTGKEILVAKNTGAGARTVTVKSVADAHQRTGDFGAYSVGAGKVAMFLIPVDGFLQADGQCYVDVEHAEMTLAVIRFP